MDKIVRAISIDISDLLYISNGLKSVNFNKTASRNMLRYNPPANSDKPRKSNLSFKDDSDLFLVSVKNVSQTEGLLDLISHGMPTLCKASKTSSMKYRLAGIAVKRPGEPQEYLQNTLGLGNSLTSRQHLFHHRSAKEVSEYERRVGPQTSTPFVSSLTGEPVNIDLDRIKKYITLLVYEKVPDTS